MLGEAGSGTDLGFPLGPVSSSQCKGLTVLLPKRRLGLLPKEASDRCVPVSEALTSRGSHQARLSLAGSCFLGSMEGLAQLDEASASPFGGHKHFHELFPALPGTPIQRQRTKDPPGCMLPPFLSCHEPPSSSQAGQAAQAGRER